MVSLAFWSCKHQHTVFLVLYLDIDVGFAARRRHVTLSGGMPLPIVSDVMLVLPVQTLNHGWVCMSFADCKLCSLVIRGEVKVTCNRGNVKGFEQRITTCFADHMQEGS